MDTMSTQTVRLPHIETQRIYEGKFRDWSPSVKAAGLLTSVGDTAEMCMKPKSDRPDSPDIIRRFRRTFRPDTGQKIVFYGKAFDPHLKWAEETRHGVATEHSMSAAKLVNPQPKTLFQQKMADIKEQNYASHVRAPLGTLHDQKPALPPNLDPREFTFGAPTIFDNGAAVLVNPNKTYAQVEEEAGVGHDNYVITHKDYYASEKVNRGYTAPNYNPDKRYGIPTDCDATGKLTRKSLQWPFETEKETITKIVPKRVDDFREKSQPQIGLFHDPIKDTMRVGPDHAFGLPLKPDEYTVGDLVHSRAPRTYLQGRDQQRGLVAAMRQHLKNLNYHTIPELIHAFRFHDKEGKGRIDKDDLREVCLNFDLPVDVWLLEQVLDYCDVNRDGMINYTEFANFLNWKEKLPEGFADVPYIPTSSQQQTAVISPHIQKEVNRAISNHHTSAEMIHAAAGPTGLDTKDFRAYGIPTIRSDLAPPRVRRMDDRQNYGDESNAYGLTNPSVFSARGVYEKDLLIPRTMEEVKEIFSKVGVQMTDETLDAIYRRVASEHPKGHVCVESFRNALDELQAAKIASGQHPLAF